MDQKEAVRPDYESRIGRALGRGDSIAVDTPRAYECAVRLLSEQSRPKGIPILELQITPSLTVAQVAELIASHLSTYGTTVVTGNDVLDGDLRFNLGVTVCASCDLDQLPGSEIAAYVRHWIQNGQTQMVVRLEGGVAQFASELTRNAVNMPERCV